MQDIPAGIQKEMQALRVLATDGTEEQKDWARAVYIMVWTALLDIPTTPIQGKMKIPEPPMRRSDSRISPLSVR